jgi:hypothetical protein
MPPAAWVQFMVMSNELVSPRILACPSDSGVARISDWDKFSWLTPFRQNSLSYVVGLHARSDSPRAWLSSDRNILREFVGACETGASPVEGFNVGNPHIGFTNGAVHGDHGHVLLNDGSVEYASPPRFREIVADPDSDPVSQTQRHYFKAR